MLLTQNREQYTNQTDNININEINTVEEKKKLMCMK